MTDDHDPAAIARAIADANLYLVLATADADGRPWASPVYFAHRTYTEYFWVSRPERQHSRNIEARRDVSIVIFDSSVPISTGRGVYMSAVAGELTGDERIGAVEVFSGRSQAHGGSAWGLAQIEPPAPLRLYRAAALDVYVLFEDDNRIPVIL
jgi:hypothetical protein